MLERKVIKDSRGRTVGYVQDEGYDAAAGILGLMLTVLLGFGILYLFVAILAAIWNAGKLARILLVGGVVAALIAVAGSESPELANKAMNLGESYVAWSRAIPITPFPNTNLTIVAVVSIAVLYFSVWLLWKPTMNALALLVATVFMTIAMTLTWGVWLGIGQALAVFIRLSAHWLLSGAMGNGLDWLQITPFCFLLALPIILRKNGGYRHLLAPSAMVEALLMVGLICVSPTIGASIVSRFGLNSVAHEIATSVGQATNGFSGGMPPILPDAALRLSINTLAAGPVAGVVLTGYSVVKRVVNRLAS